LSKLDTVLNHFAQTGKGDFESRYEVGGAVIDPRAKIAEIMEDNVKDSGFKSKSRNKDEEARHDTQELNNLLTDYINNVINTGARR
jgi:hypothetical protein